MVEERVECLFDLEEKVDAWNRPHDVTHLNFGYESLHAFPSPSYIIGLLLWVYSNICDQICFFMPLVTYRIHRCFIIEAG